MADAILPRPGQRPGASGVPCLVAGIAVFSVQDLILKLLSGTYPLSEAMVLRGLTAFPLLLVLVRLSGGYATLFTPGWRRMVARGFMMFLAHTAHYLALAALPLATTVAFYFTAPLFITVFSVLMLNEPVGPRRWAAVVLGFGGVLVMLRPGTDLFDWAALLALFSGLSHALSMIAWAPLPLPDARS